MTVQCEFCGRIQEFDPDYRICLNCGREVSADDTRIIPNPRKGRGMQGIATVCFILFVAVFFFWSKYLGRHGMALSALFYIWGFYKNYRNRRLSRDSRP